MAGRAWPCQNGSVAIPCSPFLSVFSSFRGVMAVSAEGYVSDMDNGGKRRHIILTSHPGAPGGQAAPILWGAATARERGPIVATTANAAHRNAIGTHSGSYGVYRALAIAAKQLHPLHRPDLTDTAPAERIGPHPQWFDPQKIVSIDPWGHMVGEVFADKLKDGWDIRPTIAVTKAHINM